MKTFPSSDPIFRPESIKLNRPRSHRNQLIFWDELRDTGRIRFDPPDPLQAKNRAQ